MAYRMMILRTALHDYSFPE